MYVGGMSVPARERESRRCCVYRLCSRLLRPRRQLHIETCTHMPCGCSMSEPGRMQTASSGGGVETSSSCKASSCQE